MSGFIPQKGPQKPTVVMTLGPEGFADTWKQKPEAGAIIGLRHVASGVDETGRAEAAKYAVEMHPADRELQIEAFNDFLMRWIISYAACSPNDIAQNYWAMAQDTVRDALSSAGVRAIWDRYERMLIEESPLDPPLEDEEIGELTSLLESGTLEQMVTSQAKRSRKLLRFVLDDLRRIADV